jgi:secretion/DNA translocation related TadE-like protein
VSEQGSASLALLGVAGVVMVLAVGLAAVGSVMRARVEASTAADAAALAAAPVTFLPFGAHGTPTEEAARFATLNGSRLLSCICPLDPSWEPRTVEVRTERSVEIWPLGIIEVQATGRAEFVPAMLLAAP